MTLPFYPPPSLEDLLLKGAFSSAGTHPHRLLPLPAPVGPIMGTVIDGFLSFASQICHTLPECLTVLCPEQVNRNCSRECLCLLLFSAQSLPCSLPFKPYITPILAGWCFNCCQHPAFQLCHMAKGYASTYFGSIFPTQHIMC